MGHRVRHIARPLAGPGQEDAIRGRLHRAQLGMSLKEEAVLAAPDPERGRHLAGIAMGNHGRIQDHHIDFHRHGPAHDGILCKDHQLAIF